MSEWLTGATWTAAQASEADHQIEMARLLRRVHALSIPRPARVMTPAAWIGHYRAALAARPRTGSDVPQGFRRDLADAAAQRLRSLPGFAGAAPVICHSDLHRLNLSTGGRLRLLDWEYAHVSDGYWDLAGWAANNDWSSIEAERFLAHYLERPARPAEGSRLRVWSWLYDYVSLLWSLLYLAQRPGSAHHEVLDRSRVLADRLNEG